MILRSKTVWAGLTALLASALVLGSCKGDKPDKVAVGIAIGSYVHAVAWVGDEAGHFREAGVEAEVTVMGGSAATMRTLIADQVDIGLAGGDAVLKANAAGADLVIIGGLVDRFYHRIVAREGVDDSASLRGKRIGLPFLGGPQDMAVKVALLELGLDYESEVDVVSLGREFNRMAALQNGDIDATTSQSPDSVLAKLGLHVLVDLPATNRKFPYIVIVARRSWLTSHRKQAKAVIAGLCAATVDYRSDEDKSLAVIGRHLGNADIDGAARERYRNGGPTLLTFPPRADVESLEFVVELMGAAKTDVAAMVDHTLLDEVIAAGKCQ